MEIVTLAESAAMSAALRVEDATPAGAVALSDRANTLCPRSCLGSDRSSEFGERGSNSEAGRGVQAELVEATSKVLHETVAGDDDLGGPVGAQAAHRSEPVLELVSCAPYRLATSASMWPAAGSHQPSRGG